MQCIFMMYKARIIIHSGHAENKDDDHLGKWLAVVVEIARIPVIACATNGRYHCDIWVGHNEWTNLLSPLLQKPG